MIGVGDKLIFIFLANTKYKIMSTKLVFGFPVGFPSFAKKKEYYTIFVLVTHASPPRTI